MQLLYAPLMCGTLGRLQPPTKSTLQLCRSILACLVQNQTVQKLHKVLRQKARLHRTVVCRGTR